MHGNGVSRKGIDSQHIKLLRRFALQRKPCVTQNDFNLRGTLLKERKPAICYRDDLWIDFVKTERIARLPIGCERSRAQANHSHTFRPVTTKSQRQPGARSPSVVRRGIAIL